MDLYSVRQKLQEGTSLNDLPLKVTVYVRVSTDHEEQKSSLENQLVHFTNYIKSNKNWIFVQPYIDEGITGTSDTKRENFLKMIEDAKNNKFDLIITKEISRFSRNTLDSIKYTRLLLSYGVAVLFYQDNINTIYSDSELRLTIMASLAQDEIRRLSERVKFGLHQAIKNGHILGNGLYGYKKKKNKLIIIPEEASIVKSIYEMYYYDKYSLTKIATILNAKKISKGQKSTWSSVTISRLISNPKYKGFYCAHKSEVINYMTKKVQKIPESSWQLYPSPLKIPPIISEKLWTEANKRLKSRQKTRQKTKLAYTPYKEETFPINIYCEHCQKNYLYKSTSQSFYCETYLTKGKKFCNSSIIKITELEKIMKDFIQKTNIDYSPLTDIFTTALTFKKDSTQEIQDKLTKLATLQNNLLNLRLNNEITKEEYLEKKESLNSEIIKLKIKEKQISENNSNLKNIQTITAAIPNILNSPATKSKLFSLLASKIIVQSSSTKENINLEIDLKINPSIRFNYIFQRKTNKYGTKNIKYNIFYLSSKKEM